MSKKCACQALLLEIDQETAFLYAALMRQQLDRLTFLEKAAESDDAYRKIALQLNDLLLTHWNKAARKAIREAIWMIVNGEGRIRKAEIRLLLERLDERLGTHLSAGIESAIQEKILAVYLFAQQNVLGVTPTFNLTDEKAIDWLRRDLVFWIGRHYQAGVSDKIRHLAREALRQKMGRMAAGEFFKEAFREQFRRSGLYWELLANHSITRGRVLGNIEGYVKADINYVKFSAAKPRREGDSLVCTLLDGVIFPLKHLLKVRDRLLKAGSPARVRRMAPWPKLEMIAGKRVGQLNPAFLMPPLHGHCRSRIVGATAKEAAGWEKRRLPAIASVKKLRSPEKHFCLAVKDGIGH